VEASPCYRLVRSGCTDSSSGWPGDWYTKPAAEKGSAFRRPTRTDLDWIFTVQTERSVAKDNTFTAKSDLATRPDPLAVLVGRMHRDHP
jgi:hypothetical protein